MRSIVSSAGVVASCRMLSAVISTRLRLQRLIGVVTSRASSPLEKNVKGPRSRISDLIISKSGKLEKDLNV